MLLMERHLSACQLPITKQRNNIQETNLYTLIEMVASGVGITLIPAMATNTDMVNKASVKIRLLAQSQEAARDLGLIWGPSYQRQTTIEVLAAVFQKML